MASRFMAVHLIANRPFANQWRTLVSTGVLFLVFTLLFSPAVSPGQGTAGRPMPALRFEPPVGFTGSGGDTFTPNSYHNASVKVRYFRPLRGRLEDEVRNSLMQEWQRELNRRVEYLTQPKHENMQVAGADEAILSAFTENYFGKPAMNLQIAVAASQAVAVVYIWADRDAWQYYKTSVDNFVKSIRVEAEEKPPAAGSSPQQNAARRAIAGLYLGQWMATTRFYLFSEDGRFHRGHGLPHAPGGDISRFNYQNARETDPGNSGTYRISGNELVIEVTGQNPVKAPLPVNGQVKIEGITYSRQVIAK